MADIEIVWNGDPSMTSQHIPRMRITEEEVPWPVYDLNNLVNLSRQRLREEGIEDNSLNVYHIISTIRREEIKERFHGWTSQSGRIGSRAKGQGTRDIQVRARNSSEGGKGRGETLIQIPTGSHPRPIEASVDDSD
jgi:hypothetical protein